MDYFLEIHFSYQHLTVSCKIRCVHLFFSLEGSTETLVLKFGVDFTSSFSINGPDRALSIFVPIVLLKYGSTPFSVENKIAYSDIVMDVVIIISRSFVI